MAVWAKFRGNQSDGDLDLAALPAVPLQCVHTSAIAGTTSRPRRREIAMTCWYLEDTGGRGPLTFPLSFSLILEAYENPLQ